MRRFCRWLTRLPRGTAPGSTVSVQGHRATLIGYTRSGPMVLVQGIYRPLQHGEMTR
jgi:hypothetical protein